MLRISVALLAASALSGCAVAPPARTQAVICVTDAECAAMWARAQTFLATRSGYRIRMVTDSVIETFGPISGNRSAAFTVTKQPQGMNTVIEVRAICPSTVYGCVRDVGPDAEALRDYIAYGN